jgi:hypothetical protein
MDEKKNQVVSSDNEEPIKTKKKKNHTDLLANIGFAVVAVGGAAIKFIKDRNKSKG